MKILGFILIIFFSSNSFGIEYQCEGKHINAEKEYIIKLRIKKLDVTIKTFHQGLEIINCTGKATFDISSKGSIVNSHHIYWDINCDEYQDSDLVFHKKGELKLYEDQEKYDAAFFIKNEQPTKCITNVLKSKFIADIRKKLISD